MVVIAAWVVCCVLMVLRAARHADNTPDLDQDIHYTYLEGGHILEGVNPYRRIATSDMENNAKYATYLPGIYLVAAAMQVAGLRDFSRWLDFWLGVSIIFWAGIGALLFARVYGPRRGLVAALAASALWLFNRWSLHVLFIAHTDFVALFFFVLCVMLLPRRSRWAWLAFGVSLSIKHIAIIAVPLLLIAQWRAVPAARRRAELAWSVAAMAAVPLAVSIPFILAGPWVFAKSMLFSFTRGARAHMDLMSLDAALHWEGGEGRVPLLLLIGAVTWLFARRRLGINAALFLIMLSFTWFNSVFFRQYSVWPIPFALMALLGGGAETNERAAQDTAPVPGRPAG